MSALFQRAKLIRIDDKKIRIIMKKATFKKRFITLVEMMIVMFLIAMITGVIAYNYTGSLEEGKAFKTKHGMDKIQTVLNMHFATNPEDFDKVETEWQNFIALSPMVKNAEELKKDGWGGDYKLSKTTEGDVIITSEKYNTYVKNKKGSMFKEDKG